MNRTKQRQLVYETVQNSFSHPTADDVFQSVRAAMPNISLGTVYRNLGVLVDMGMLRKIAVPGQPDHFDRMTEWHDHMVCEKCGRLFDVTLEHSLPEQLAERSGMHITGYSLVANCICPDCAAHTTSQS